MATEASCDSAPELDSQFLDELLDTLDSISDAGVGDSENLSDVSLLGDDPFIDSDCSAIEMPIDDAENPLHVSDLAAHKYGEAHAGVFNSDCENANEYMYFEHPTDHKHSSAGTIGVFHCRHEQPVVTMTSEGTYVFRLSLEEKEEPKPCKIVQKWKDTDDKPQWKIQHRKIVKGSKFMFSCGKKKTKTKGVVGIDCPECLAELKQKNELQKLCPRCSEFINQGKKQVHILSMYPELFYHPNQRLS